MKYALHLCLNYKFSGKVKKKPVEFCAYWLKNDAYCVECGTVFFGFTLILLMVCPIIGGSKGTRRVQILSRWHTKFSKPPSGNPGSATANNKVVNIGGSRGFSRLPRVHFDKTFFEPQAHQVLASPTGLAPPCGKSWIRHLWQLAYN